MKPPGISGVPFRKTLSPAPAMLSAVCLWFWVGGGWGRGGDGGRRQEGSVFSGNPCIVMAAGHLQLTSLCDWLSL